MVTNKVSKNIAKYEHCQSIFANQGMIPKRIYLFFLGKRHKVVAIFFGTYCIRKGLVARKTVSNIIVKDIGKNTNLSN